jgi:hypothetical protein
MDFIADQQEYVEEKRLEMEKLEKNGYKNTITFGQNN